MFRFGGQKRRASGNPPAGSLVENVMEKHRRRLTRIVVKLDVKIKLTIVRK
jgi:hypothetical protein